VKELIRAFGNKDVEFITVLNKPDGNARTYRTFGSTKVHGELKNSGYSHGVSHTESHCRLTHTDCFSFLTIGRCRTMRSANKFTGEASVT
jgi:hypothetical protein